MTEFGTAKDLYFGGDMEASIALSGQVCGRIDAVRPVAEILDDIETTFSETVADWQRSTRADGVGRAKSRSEPLARSAASG